MPDAATPPATQGKTPLVIPADVQAKYADLLAMIQKSESMNDEERQYWINILPIMTPEQVQNLRDILENERKQLAAIDAKYQTEIQKIGSDELVRRTDEERSKQRNERRSKEASHRTQEEKKADELLKMIEETGKQ